MSPKLPVVSGQQLIKAFGKMGYYIRSQQGSHVHLRHPIRPPLTIPRTGRSLAAHYGQSSGRQASHLMSFQIY